MLFSFLVKAQQLLSPILPKDYRQSRLCFEVPLSYVIGDVERGNDLHTYYRSHQTYHLFRECDCLTESSDNLDIICTYLKSCFPSSTKNGISFYDLNGRMGGREEENKLSWASPECSYRVTTLECNTHPPKKALQYLLQLVSHVHEESIPAEEHRPMFPSLLVVHSFTDH